VLGSILSYCGSPTNFPATASGRGSAKVSMAPKNLGAATQGIQLSRFADVDADKKALNNFDYTNQTAYGLKADDYYGPTTCFLRESR
jgi:hypothetical protein